MHTLSRVASHLKHSHNASNNFFFEIFTSYEENVILCLRYDSFYPFAGGIK